MASGTYIRFVAAQSESGKIHVTVRMGDSAGSTVAAVVIAGFPTPAVAAVATDEVAVDGLVVVTVTVEVSTGVSLLPQAVANAATGNAPITATVARIAG